MLLQAGGTVQQRKINDLSEIAQEFDLVVNCTGLGSKELFKDDKLTPVRWVTVCAVAFVCAAHNCQLMPCALGPHGEV